MQHFFLFKNRFHFQVLVFDQNISAVDWFSFQSNAKFVVSVFVKLVINWHHLWHSTFTVHCIPIPRMVLLTHVLKNSKMQ